MFLRMSKRWSELLWWVGVPLGLFVLTWAPYWITNLLLREHPWWRIMMISPGVFDTHTYLQWMGASVQGIAPGNPIGWFMWVLRGLAAILLPYVSLPELWIISRWVTLVLLVWVTASTISGWTRLDQYRARLIALAFYCILFLSLGMRPGVFSWYYPFGVLACACVIHAYLFTERQRWVRALLALVSGGVLASIYPWFFMMIVAWGGVVTAAVSIRQKKMSWLIGACILIAGSVILAAPALARWVYKPSLRPLLDMYTRTGLVVAHAPFLSNTVLLMVAWIALLGWLGYVYKMYLSPQVGFFLSSFWFTLFVLWFHTPFLGLFLYPDHLISIVVLMSWVTLAAVIHLMVRKEQKEMSVPTPSNILRLAMLGIAIGASLFFFYVLWQPIHARFFYKFDPYLIHLANWLSLSVAAWLLYLHAGKEDRCYSVPVLRAVIVVSVVLGMCGVASIIYRDSLTSADIAKNKPMITWIDHSLPPSTHICSDPKTANLIAAHTGRIIYPAESTMFYPETNESVLRRLEILVGAYDVVGADDVARFQHLTEEYRSFPCGEKEKYRRFFGRFGGTDKEWNEFFGCQETSLTDDWQRVMRAIQARTVSVGEFARVCPAILISNEKHLFWRLPVGYVSRAKTDDLELWQISTP